MSLNHYITICIHVHTHIKSSYFSNIIIYFRSSTHRWVVELVARLWCPHSKLPPSTWSSQLIIGIYPAASEQKDASANPFFDGLVTAECHEQWVVKFPVRSPGLRTKLVSSPSGNSLIICTLSAASVRVRVPMSFAKIIYIYLLYYSKISYNIHFTVLAWQKEISQATPLHRIL